MLLACLAFLLAQTSARAGSAAADFVALPPEIEDRSSPSGRYLLQIRLRSNAKVHAARSTATLYEIDSSARKALWSRELPHRPRPRFFVVADSGHAVLIDEWLNVRSAFAVMVLDRNGATLAQFDLEAVRAALDVPLASLAPRARHGIWIQAPPQISARGDAVEVAAADRVFSIRLSDGALSVR